MPPKINLNNNNQIIDYYNNLNFTQEQIKKYIDEYIFEEATKQKKSYQYIYNNQFKDVHHLPDIMKHKFYYEPYGYISKIIKDADLINSDPDYYINTFLTKIEDLKKMVEITSYLYYNDDCQINDNSFDALEYHLKKRLKLKNRLYDKIGAPPIDKIKKQLLYGLPSLEKIKPGESQCHHFILNTPTMLWSHKLDGVSCMAIYKHGKLIDLCTRGDGKMGGGIIALASYLNIPQKIVHKGTFVVRGELILAKDKWVKYKQNFTNARSFVVAQTNTMTLSSYLPDIDFIAYQVMNNNNQKMTPFDGLQQLINLGFHVVKHDIINNAKLYDIMSLYINERQHSYYNIDGLVLTKNEPLEAIKLLQPNDEVTSPTYSMAFKMMLEEQKRSTEVLNVEWNISRYGRYVPVVIYKAVYINGVRLHRATGHNANHIKQYHIGLTTPINVSRSGDVIPAIDFKSIVVDQTIQPIYPDDKYKWHWDKINIVLDDIDSNKEVQIKRILFFFKTIGLEQFGDKTAEKFFDNGLTTPEMIINAKIPDFMKMKGIGKKKAEKYYNDIRKIMQTCSPDRLIVASSTYHNKFISRQLLKMLLNDIPNILELTKEEILYYFKHHRIAGFGPVKINIVANNIPLIKQYLDSFAKEDLVKAIGYYNDKKLKLKDDGYNKMIEGKKFILTNFINDNYEFEDYILDHQGEIVDTVTKDVVAIINGNPQDISKKMVEGSKLNIPIYTFDEFMIQFNCKNYKI